jgi:lipopolysaccharide transport protein LptA
MTGVAQKLLAVVAAVALCLGLLISHPVDSAFAQNEGEPETAPIETPQAEPTEWVPITAGDVERGAPAASPEGATSPVSDSSPASAPTAEAAPSPAAANSPASMETPGTAPGTTSGTIWHSTISRERKPEVSHSEAKESQETSAPTPVASSSTSATSGPKTKASKGGNGPEIVPANSPFGTFGSQKGPIDINSDTGTLDYQNKFFLYTGHVHAVQAGGDLTCDKLRVQYGQDFNDVKMLYADGNVRMSQGTRWITSDHAVLDQTKHILTFTGNPVVHDGQDQITGSIISVDLVSGKSNVENPRMVIFPRDSKNPDNGDAP